MSIQRIQDFKSIILKLASPQDILSWSYGEVLKPETINYRTQRAEKDGLFSERIFGPEKDFECYCGKYKRVRYKGIVCDKCGVEVTRSIVRRERMGHIALAAPVSHIWFLRTIPSRIGLVIDLSVVDLERVIYFAGYIITSIDEEKRKEFLHQIEQELKQKIRLTKTKQQNKELAEVAAAAREEVRSLASNTVISGLEYQRLSLRYPGLFEAGSGAETLRSICEKVDLKKLDKQLSNELEETDSIQKRKKIVGRLKVVRGFLKSNIRPEWMFLSTIPIMPPALRPMVQLDGGRHATSDVNDLYRRIINRNNRLKKLIELNSPEVIVRNEKRMLQEAVDALIDNTIKKRQSGPARSQVQKRPLRSIADLLKGKQGRFRKNLLGKRVDYSGRSVIVVGPELKLHQCGLPKHMALELFRPFIINKVIERSLAYNVRRANRLIDEAPDEVWAILEEVIKGKLVLLNRAPTLHRLGIQAFQPILTEGRAIELHPLVCQAFNADFDGDQMAVHVPLSEKAQQEARELMLSSLNLLKPGDGDPVVNPTQDIVVGCFWLTMIVAGARGEGKAFASPNEAISAYDFGIIDLQAKINVRVTATAKYRYLKSDIIETSVGRLIFNSALPSDFDFINKEMRKKDLQQLARDLIGRYLPEETPRILDRIKDLGFAFATKSGISWGMLDVVLPHEKESIVAAAWASAHTIDEQFNQELLTVEEKHQLMVELWEKAKKEVDDKVPLTLGPLNPIYLMVTSAARGSWDQVNQMAGMKGLVVNPAGRTIERPIVKSYKEGFTVLDYFIASHGTRKGTADTALKTAAAGYLTRRLVDVAQDVVIVEEDCGDKKGLEVTAENAKYLGRDFAWRLTGRVLAHDIRARSQNGQVGDIDFKKGTLLSSADVQKIEAAGVDRVFIRSPITCRSFRGVCSVCYGTDLGRGEQVKVGEAVGVIAAQAIGEPGTQLTLRTFHTGGIASASDITLGLPRVEEVLELRQPKNKAVIATVAGEVVSIEEQGNEKIIRIRPTDTKKLSRAKKALKAKKDDIEEYVIPSSKKLLVSEGQSVASGERLTDGAVDIRELMRFSEIKHVQDYILQETARVYILHGTSINMKHLEVVVRQMLSRLRVKDPGNTVFLPGQMVTKDELIEENRAVRKSGGRPAKCIQLVMGISKVALTAEGFLSAASFQETSRVLVAAANEGREDKLRGLKENVIIGRIIPAGTGFRQD